MSKLTDTLESALKQLEERYAQHEAFHMRVDEAIPLYRVALAILAYIKDPHVTHVVFAMEEAVDSIAKLTTKIHGEERNRIVSLIANEANRIFNKQELNYPSNVLDVVAANLRMQNDTNLIDPPAGMSHRLVSTPPPEYEAEFAAVLEALDDATTPAHPKTTRAIANGRAYLEKLRKARPVRR